MKVAIMTFGILLAASVSACGQDSGGGAPSTAGSGSGPTCESLVGHPVGHVRSSEACSDSSGSSGSGGCYPKAKQQGHFYWIYYPEDGSKVLMGGPGGNWKSGPESLTTSQIAAVVGC